jgi:hypothetical protein
VLQRRADGTAAVAQPKTPTANKSAAAFVSIGTPKRWWSAGKLAVTIEPIRKCTVTAVETRMKSVI